MPYINHMWTLCGGGLGDVWTSVSYALRNSQEPEVRIARAFHNLDRGELVAQIAAIMESGHRVRVWDHSGAMRYLDAYGHELMPVMPHYRWSGGSGRLCHQLIGVSQEVLKSCTEEEIATFEASYPSDRLGRPRTLFESVRLLSRCKLFVGIDSGFTHVNYSIGAPGVYILNRSTDEMMGRHVNQRGVWVATMADARHHLSMI